MVAAEAEAGTAKAAAGTVEQAEAAMGPLSICRATPQAAATHGLATGAALRASPTSSRAKRPASNAALPSLRTVAASSSSRVAVEAMVRPLGMVEEAEAATVVEATEEATRAFAKG